jgi:hypothetical protein
MFRLKIVVKNAALHQGLFQNTKACQIDSMFIESRQVLVANLH